MPLPNSKSYNQSNGFGQSCKCIPTVKKANLTNSVLSFKKGAHTLFKVNKTEETCKILVKQLFT